LWHIALLSIKREGSPNGENLYEKVQKEGLDPARWKSMLFFINLLLYELLASCSLNFDKYLDTCSSKSSINNHLLLVYYILLTSSVTRDEGGDDCP
jgi:hypothetical protein